MSSSAGPADGDGFLRGLGEAGGFDGGFAGMFAAETSAEIGDDHADLVLGDVKRAGDLAADAEGVLAGRPDRYFAGVIPFGDGGARFHRAMLDVGNVKRRGEFFRGGFANSSAKGLAATPPRALSRRSL